MRKVPDSFTFFLDHIWAVYGHEPLVADAMAQEEIQRHIDLSAEAALKRLEELYPTAPEDKRPPVFDVLEQYYREAHFRNHRLFGPLFICIQPHYHQGVIHGQFADA